ncbi:MAG TPA: hypothetical protein VMM85_03700 [Methylomirabilota bacterium]|nr:hypothetical protein [Methylomirabilota bacterium]
MTRCAALFAALALMLSALPVLAASSVQLDARVLVGGRYEVGGWVAVATTLINEGEPTEGNLSAETRAGTVQRYVEMPAGARKVITLYVQPDAFQRKVTVTYQEPNGTVTAEVDVRVLEQSNAQIAIVGDGGGSLRPQISGPDRVNAPEPITLTAADIPDRPEPLNGLSAIVWAADGSALSEAQRDSLERWVGDGGHLVVVGGADWQARTAAFTDLLPLRDLAAVDDVAHAVLASWSGVDAPAESEATVSTGALHDDARALVTAEDGTILASMRSIGAGRTILLGTDLATDAYRGWEGAPHLWSRLLPSGGMLAQFFGEQGFFPEEADNSMSQALQNLPGLEIPPAELLLAIIAAYIILIGPISYVVLRRLDRREMAWITAPLLVVLFTACSYGIGTTLKGGDLIVNQISLVRSSGLDGAASVESYTGIFSPQRSSYDVSVDADALMAPLRPNFFFDGRGGQPRGTDVVADQGNPARIRDLSIGVFGFESVRADGVIDHSPSLSVTWSGQDGEMVGTVTNIGELPVEDVAYVSGAGGEMIGDLEPGESREFKLPSTNFNGSAASDQVYGFGGFDPTSDAERETTMRRRVIDALVGYGGGFMPMPVADSGLQGGRGPFVIGWSDRPGPLPIEIDGFTPQRYTQSVEVISVRPSLGTGDVTIGPSQMITAILDTEGDAQIEGAMLYLGDGSATIGLALPLEASDMRVTSVEILVGGDPGMIFDNQGNFGGFWPDGYTLELQDPADGEWSVLGDLSDGTTFKIDDPSTAITATGRVVVRITGSGIDVDFGPNHFFVSARVNGVIGE